MPYLPGNIAFKYSGGGANSSPAASLGGVISSVDVTPSDEFGSVLEGLFANADAAECLAGSVKYRCIYVKNDTPQDMRDFTIYLDNSTWSGDVEIHMAIGPAGVGGTEELVANENTEPAGVVWQAHDYEFFEVFDILYTSWVGIWFRRTVPAGMYANDPDVQMLRCFATLT